MQQPSSVQKYYSQKYNKAKQSLLRYYKSPLKQKLQKIEALWHTAEDALTVQNVRESNYETGESPASSHLWYSHLVLYVAITQSSGHGRLEPQSCGHYGIAW